MAYYTSSQQQQKEETLECIIDQLIFRNSGNGYSVYLVHDRNLPERPSADDCDTIAGQMPEFPVRTTLRVSGVWKTHRKYGETFCVYSYQELLPVSEEGIKRYLCSGMFRGVGEYTAQKIIDAFGTETLEILEKTPERLLEVKGIKKKRAEMILSGWLEHRSSQNTMVFLHGLGVGPATIDKIYQMYGENSIRVITENPYCLADDIEGIGFKAADEVGTRLGIAKDHFERLRHGILYLLNQNTLDGHCYKVKQDLLWQAENLLEVDMNHIVKTVRKMEQGRDIVTVPIDKSGTYDAANMAVYPKDMFFAEKNIAERLAGITQAPKKIRFPKRNLVPMIEHIVQVVYDAYQEKALLQSMKNKCMVITGGPGTGKTTLIRGIITAYNMTASKILLAAPTGKAAKRMQEATGKAASTIHRLLEATPDCGFKRNERNPLEGDILIVDECSMIDTMLMNSLLRAVPDHMTLILTGDIDQLPSVGAGNVLRDIIESNTVPVVRLQHIFRQAEASRIITNAHMINDGKMPDLSYNKDSDFFFCTRSTGEIQDKIVSLVLKEIPQIKNIPGDQIQVLSPMKKGDAGTLVLNQRLQDALNPGRKQIVFRDQTFRPGDRVMQIRNDYEKNVFNGDVGKITKLDEKDRMLTVNFDGRMASYSYNELEDLILSYAATVHKSQGSEYQAVVMPVTMAHRIMLQRNMMYTGVTRAKKLIILVGDPSALSFAVQNNPAVRRNTMLKQKLQQAFSKIGRQIP